MKTRDELRQWVRSNAALLQELAGSKVMNRAEVRDAAFKLKDDDLVWMAGEIVGELVNRGVKR